MRQIGQMDQVLGGRIVREVPAGDLNLPSRALTVQGGGQIMTDPRDSKGLTALNRTFQMDIELAARDVALYGGRVFVRFEHDNQPLAVQWYRKIRPILLSRLHA